MNKKRICLVTSGHPSFDERIFWKFGLTLTENDFEVMIISSNEQLQTEKKGIKINSFNGNDLDKNNKIKRFYNFINDFNPQIIICSEPLPVIAAVKFRRQQKSIVKVILDVTEFYPHQNALKGLNGFRKYLKYLKLFLFNVYAANAANQLIIGEKNKAKLFNWIALFKKKDIIGYYSPKKFFNYSYKDLSNPITFCYLGEQSKERGFYRFINVIKKLSLNSNYSFRLIFIGSSTDSPIKYLNVNKNIEIEEMNWVEYDELSDVMNKANFFLDLRDKNKIFNRSMPIKVFDYMACGRPVIFSNLDSLSELSDIRSFTYLVEPDQIDTVVKILNNYLSNKELYLEHCQAARRLFEEKYNWELLGDKLLKLIAN